jgi:hypothetical protein
MKKQSKKPKLTKYQIMALVFAKKYAEKHNWRGYPMTIRFLDK